MERLKETTKEQLLEYFKANPGPVTKVAWRKWKMEHERFPSYPQLRAYRNMLIKEGVFEGTPEELEEILEKRFKGVFPSPLNRARWVMSRMLRAKKRMSEKL